LIQNIQKTFEAYEECNHSMNYRDEHNFHPEHFYVEECNKKLQKALRSSLSRGDDKNMFNYCVPTGKQIKFGLPRICSLCQKESEKMKTCNGCLNIFYCSTECQTKDWPFHKDFCLHLHADKKKKKKQEEKQL